MQVSRRQFVHTSAVSAAYLGLSCAIPLCAAATGTHIVRKGDTLSGIAVRYGTSVRAIKQANGLNSDLIKIGQQLTIPGGGGGATSTDFLAKIKAENRSISVRRDNWKTIVVHHSAIKYGNAVIYDRSHRERGMRNGLAYHFVIGNGIDSGDGEIEIGPRWRNQLLGGHVRNYKVNLTAIGICLVGNFEKTHPTRRQIDAFTQLMDWLRSDVLRKKTRFAGHKDIEKNLCPGKNFPLAAMHARYD